MIDYDVHKWRHHLLDIKGSMLREVSYRVFVYLFWSAAVVYLHQHHYQVAISDKAHLLIGLALGLLLVFRTNASYDRFWEARKLWGSIINETRNLGRAACVYLADAPELVEKLLRWTMAFPYAVMLRLRNGSGSGLGTAKDWFAPAEVDSILKTDHVPLAVARRMSEQLAEARQRGLIGDYVQTYLDQNVQLLVDYLGACERIHRTPLPFAYVVHLRRALLAYCFSLPFALVETFGWLTVPGTLLIAYILYGIEEIGVEIEDPFGRDDNDLPLERFCEMIEGNLRSLLETMPEKKPPVMPV
jgi:putative membrane protein